MTNLLVDYEIISEIDFNGDENSCFGMSSTETPGAKTHDIDKLTKEKSDRIHTEISGYEFNKIYQGVKFYKFMNNNLKHHKFKYELGLNIDNKPFNPNGTCLKGGLYFCEESTRYLFWNHYGEKMATIMIPDNARVYIEEDKFKADRIIIDHIIDFDDIDNDFWVNLFRRDIKAFRFIKNPSEDCCKEVMRRDGMYLQYVTHKTKEICSLAVSQNGLALQYVNDQDHDICALALRESGQALRYVKNQTDELCRLAVSRYGNSLEYVLNQTEEICRLAVQQNGFALRYVNNEFRTKEICGITNEKHYV